jgi:hypothetical protein
MLGSQWHWQSFAVKRGTTDHLVSLPMMQNARILHPATPLSESKTFFLRSRIWLRLQHLDRSSE